MNDMHVVSDLVRTGARSTMSALPNAPVIPEPERAPAGTRLTRVRLILTVALRRLADTVDPAGQPAVLQRTSGNGSHQPCI